MPRATEVREKGIGGVHGGREAKVLEKYPQARRVFRKHFGEGCFNCPGSRVESIQFGALMHNKDVNAILEDLNAQVK